MKLRFEKRPTYWYEGANSLVRACVSYKQVRRLLRQVCTEGLKDSWPSGPNVESPSLQWMWREDDPI